MTDATNFSMNDMVLEYSEEDYKPQRKEPAPGLWFEFAVREASVTQARAGHLQVKLVTEALDGNGTPMFKKWVNIPVPVSLGDKVAPAYAKGLWLSSVRPLFPNLAAYDRSEKDEITGEKIYWKGSEQICKGKQFDAAIVAQNKAIGEKAREVAIKFIEEGDEAQLPDFAGGTVYGKTVASKDGQYINIDRMFSEAPADAEICYDSKAAFGR